ncbi:MAG TPA: hypothetical protein DCZ91_02025 [Lachnospiraceae bacterium]|nr:hypothetical protein [Lachnospiraceae bacterium]
MIYFPFSFYSASGHALWTYLPNAGSLSPPFRDEPQTPSSDLPPAEYLIFNLFTLHLSEA